MDFHATDPLPYEQPLNVIPVATERNNLSVAEPDVYKRQVCVLNAIQGFIPIWVGSEYVLGKDVLIAILATFYVTHAFEMCIRDRVETV